MSAANSASPIDFGPIRLSYAAALRGVKPRQTGTPFAYAQIAPRDPDALSCLAASNPEGRFFGLMADAAAATAAQNRADARQVDNVTFLATTPAQLLAAPKLPLPELDYLVVDTVDAPPDDAARDALGALAARALKPGGLFAWRYRAYPDADAILQFLLSEFTPEMNAQQAQEFLPEIKALGALYFAQNDAARTALEQAIAAAKPENFFAACAAKRPASSGTLAAMIGLLPRQFAFAGDADIGANYLQLATPVSAHAVLESCRTHLLYEPLKDFAMQRLVRNDIWARLPVEQAAETPLLFGNFTYGILTPREQIPSRIKAHGTTIDLTQKPYAGLVELMTTLPITIGDFLHHSLGKGLQPEAVVEAMNILIATGIASPMRASYNGKNHAELSHPQWSDGFNRYLEKAPITSARVLLASTIVGSPVTVPARDALVMQAVGRVGMADSVGALLPELLRVTTDPALAAQVMDVMTPTPEQAFNMIQNVVSQSILRWYAYGILAA